MQRTHTGYGVDLVGMAAAAGFAQSMNIRSATDVTRLAASIRAGAGPLFAAVKIDHEVLPLVLPPRETSHLKNRFRLSVLGPDAVLA